MMKAPAGYKYLTHDPKTGIYQWFRLDELSGEMSICRTQDVGAIKDILNDNKREQYNAKGQLAKRGKWGVKAATIPYILVDKWLNEEGWDALDPRYSDKLKQKLNSNEYAYLRCAEFKL